LTGTIPDNTGSAVLSDQSAVDVDHLKSKRLMMKLDQIGWWDEKHIPQVVGEVSDINYHFGHNKEGVYDPTVDLKTIKKVSVSKF
jgi:hypothetical protein